MNDQLYKSAYERSYVDVLRHRAQLQPADTALVILGQDGEEHVRWSYRDVDEHALRFASAIARRTERGDRILLATDDPTEFISSFLGTLYAGCVAVPVNSPSRRERLDKVLAIAADCRPRLIVASDVLMERLDAELPAFTARPQCEAVAYSGLLPLEHLAGDAVPTRSAPLAFLQYTSGSTGTPKGVMVSQQNLLANMRMLANALGAAPGQTWVSWLPLFHDMGLVGSMLNSLYTGTTSVLLTPQYFVRRPGLWLETISRYGAVGSGGPNFAYELCARVYARRPPPDFDLSTWRVAYNGAEPIRASTLRRFGQVFGACGFAPNAFLPCYGMAEATLFVAGGPRGRSPSVEKVSASELAIGQAVPLSARSTDDQVRELVGCGEVSSELDLRIVNPESLRLCGPREIGEIWIRGASVCKSYWERDALTRDTFHAQAADGSGPYLRTGDLGYLVDNELFVTGRMKDIIILNGRNFYPQDIEQAAVVSHAALEGRLGAAFAVEGTASERVVLVQEISVSALRQVTEERLTSVIVASVAALTGATLHEVVFVPRATVPITTSGKVRRRESKARYLEGRLNMLSGSTASN